MSETSEDLYVYQPWSIPLLHTTLPDKLLKELIQLTDLIEKDEDRESVKDDLAGEIEDEWKIDPILLTNISFKDYIIQLSREYFKTTMFNYYIEDNQKFENINLSEEEIVMYEDSIQDMKLHADELGYQWKDCMRQEKDN